MFVSGVCTLLYVWTKRVFLATYRYFMKGFFKCVHAGCLVFSYMLIYSWFGRVS